MVVVVVLLNNCPAEDNRYGLVAESLIELNTFGFNGVDSVCSFLEHTKEDFTAPAEWKGCILAML